MDNIIKLSNDNQKKAFDIIKELDIKNVGFASTSGFSFNNHSKDWILISGDDLYSL